MKRYLALLALCALTAGRGHAGNVVLPPEPSRDDIPGVNQLGERVRGVALPTTTVVRWSDGEIMVLYGYIVGRMNGTSDYFYWNRSGMPRHHAPGAGRIGARGVFLQPERHKPVAGRFSGGPQEIHEAEGNNSGSLCRK